MIMIILIIMKTRTMMIDYDSYDASLIMITKIEVGMKVVSMLLVRGRESENIISSPGWP